MTIPHITIPWDSSGTSQLVKRNGINVPRGYSKEFYREVFNTLVTAMAQKNADIVV